MITSHEQEALKQLEELRHSTDTEGAHVDADNVLCKLLVDLGYKDVVKAYNLVDKWYA